MSPKIDQQLGTSKNHLMRTVGLAFLCRLVLNTTKRFVYPFAPVLSRGLNVPLGAITSLIAFNQATSVVCIFTGPIADRFGYRRMMILGMGMLSLGLLATAAMPFYGVIVVAVILAGLGKSLFDPALQAYVGERVSFQRRGLVIGILEMSWAGSTLLGIPMVALLIDRFGWRAPFFALGVLGVTGFLALLIIFPRSEDGTPASVAIDLKAGWQRLIRNRAAVGALGFALMVSAANDNFFVVYGVWLETDFGLSILALGFGAALIGVAELSGESLTALLADRVGLKRALLIGVSVSSFSYAVVPMIGKTLPLSLGGLFFIFLAFEFTIVTGISLCTEFLPGSRATMVAAFMGAGGAGRVIGALLGGRLWLSGGIVAVGSASAMLSAVGLAALVWGVKDWHPQKDAADATKLVRKL